jgi:hypothetical protein
MKCYSITIVYCIVHLPNLVAQNYDLHTVCCFRLNIFIIYSICMYIHTYTHTRAHTHTLSLSLSLSLSDGFAQSIARQQPSKHVPTRAMQQYGGSVCMWSAPCNSMSALFSVWSVLRLYNGSLFVVQNSSDEYRVKNHGDWS